MIRKTIIIALTTFTIVSCKNEIKKAENSESLIENTIEDKTENTQNEQVGSHVHNELDCMVNDAYMGKTQIPVPVNGKTYYGCCEMCVGKLTNDETARIGIDPFSKKPVDKTEAYIVVMKAEGDVAYFESQENYLKYIKLH